MSEHVSEKRTSFPKGFLWGTSTSSYQVEGGIENSDWAKAGREGKVPVAGVACDHYDRYEEDFNIARSLYCNSQRISIEWSRIEPKEGVFDEQEILHYQNVVKALKERGLEPFVTLWHFTLPIWFADSGGFSRKDASAIFARYAKVIVEALGKDVRFYVTMNEPMVVAGHGFVSGKWPPFKRDPLTYLRVVQALIRSHKRAYSVMKKVNLDIQIGVSKNYSPVFGTNIFGSLIGKMVSWWYNDFFLNNIAKQQDFIALNHYFRTVFWLEQKRKSTHPQSDMGWELYPAMLGEAIRGVARHKKPIYISENGLADKKDTQREWFITESLKAVQKTIHEGLDVRGYTHWSLLDNFEWAEGFGPRFGLVEIDYDNNNKRIIRKSALRYAEICKNNSL